MPDFDMYKAYQTPVLRVAAKNIPEFYELIELANKQAAALRETMNKLDNFHFDLEFSAGMKTPPGEMEAASSVTKVIPTK